MYSLVCNRICLIPSQTNMQLGFCNTIDIRAIWLLVILLSIDWSCMMQSHYTFSSVTTPFKFKDFPFLYSKFWRDLHSIDWGSNTNKALMKALSFISSHSVICWCRSSIHAMWVVMKLLVPWLMPYDGKERWLFLTTYILSMSHFST